MRVRVDVHEHTEVTVLPWIALEDVWGNLQNMEMSTRPLAASGTNQGFLRQIAFSFTEEINLPRDSEETR